MRQLILRRMLTVLVALCLIAGCMPAFAATYTPGTYTAGAPGHNGDVQVRVTVSDSAILSVEVTDSYETQGIRETPFARVPQDIVKYQSLAVDTVTGATLASNAIIKATEMCLLEAGANVDDLYAPVEKEKQTDAQDSADVIIIGAGGAGMCAAIAASDEGASVLVIEKTAAIGGNSIVSGGIYNAVDPKRQKEIAATSIEGCYALTQKEAVSEKHQAYMDRLKAELDEYVASGSQTLFDSVALHVLQTYDGGDYIANLDLIEYLCENALPCLEWLEGMGLEINPKVQQGTGSLWQRTHYPYGPCATAYFEVFGKKISEKDNCRILFDTTATKLITDSTGHVTGVEARGIDGNSIVLHANKGVVLATGGFAGNVEMRVKYCQGEKWPELGATLPTSNVSGVTGDGIRMAEENGAQLVDMDQIQLLQSCDPVTGMVSNAFHNGVASYVFINAEGNRFINETGRRDVVSQAIIAQPDGFAWLVQSADSISDPENTTTSGGTPILEMIARGESGWCSAETLEELAEITGMPYDNLQKAIDDYNDHVASQQPDEFGRALFSYEYVNGPWYAYRRAPAAHHTMGGVKIDTHCQVYGSDGQPITGLFAAGEVTGGIHGGNRLGGNAILDFVVNGRNAGTNAATSN